MACLVVGVEARVGLEEESTEVVYVVSKQVCVLVGPHRASFPVAYHHQSCQPCRNVHRTSVVSNGLS